MDTTFQKSLSILLASLLALACISTSGVQATSTPSAQPAQETMPDGLMGALLAASAQPFEVGADGYRAHSGGLDLTLRAGGLQASGDGFAWGLTLGGLGRGEQIAALSEAAITQTDSRLEYRRGALTEWYRDTALGLEQGFTIHQSPRGAGPLVLRLDLATDLVGTLDADGGGLSFTTPDGRTLRYDHLRAWDADGKPLDAALRYTSGQVAIQVRDWGAAYPITVDPLVYLEQKVIVSDAADDHFGVSVALDGDTVLVGANSDDVGANENQGSAYVFVRNDTTWTQQAHLLASDGAANDQFGYAVALDGDTALVGTPKDNVATNNRQGSAYVFIRSGTTWSQQQKLTAADGAASDEFGYSVALEGDTALVGADGDTVGANAAQGSAYVFTRSGATWTQQAQLTASDGMEADCFGYSVALSGDTALVGAPFDTVGANLCQGSAYVFTRSGTTWTQQAQLIAADGAGDDCFGIAVALSGDTALVGADADNVNANEDQGSAYVFTRSGTTWTQQAKLTASDGAVGDIFGRPVALEGDTALVGARGDDFGSNWDQGSAYVFTRSGTTWSQQQKLIAADGAGGDRFGYAVALSGDTALVGAPIATVDGIDNQGLAYVFTRSGTTWSLQAKLTALGGAADDYFGISVALSGDTALVGVYGEDIGIDDYDQGAAYVFVRSGTTWMQQAQLSASDGTFGDKFGWSAALDGDTALVGAPEAEDNVGHWSGAVYVFTRSGTTWTEQAKLTSSDSESNDEFGTSVALEGTTALVGAPGKYIDPNFDQGAAYVFTDSGATWMQRARLTASDGAANDRFGHTVALSSNTALVGAYLDDVNTNADQGSAYAFVYNAPFWSLQAKLTAADGAAEDWFGHSVAIAGNIALVGAPSVSSPGAAYAFTRGGTTWTQSGKLTASDGAAGDRFGYAVSLSDKAEAALVGASTDDIGAHSNQGSAYVFVRSGTIWTQHGKLTASDGAADDRFGNAVAFAGDTALVGAHLDDVGANGDQGSAYFYDITFLFNSIYLPLVLKNTP